MTAWIIPGPAVGLMGALMSGAAHAGGYVAPIVVAPPVSVAAEPSRWWIALPLLALLALAGARVWLATRGLAAAIRSAERAAPVLPGLRPGGTISALVLPSSCLSHVPGTPYALAFAVSGGVPSASSGSATTSSVGTRGTTRRNWLT